MPRVRKTEELRAGSQEKFPEEPLLPEALRLTPSISTNEDRVLRAFHADWGDLPRAVICPGFELVSISELKDGPQSGLNSTEEKQP